MKKLKSVYGLVLLAMLIALGIVLSAFLQFRLIGDIKIDLSYIVIVVICYLYGGIVGGISAGLIAGLESLLLSNYGFSISWTSANIIIGLMTGLMISHNPIKHKVLKHVLNIGVMTMACAIGLLLVKTVIECNLYNDNCEIVLNKKIEKKEKNVKHAFIFREIFIDYDCSCNIKYGFDDFGDVHIIDCNNLNHKIIKPPKGKFFN